MKFVYVGLAGFIGAILRVQLGNIIHQYNTNTLFPFHTLLINLMGSFILAYFIETTKQKIKITEEFKIAISTGLLGSFTTFSTFSVESLILIQNKSYFLYFIYLLSSFIGGLLFSWFGIKAGITNQRKNKETKNYR